MKKNLLSLSFGLILAGLAITAAADDSTNTVKTVKPYVLKTCIVSGEKLGEMGDPYTITNAGRQIKFCCEECAGKFKKNPAKFTKKIEDKEKKEAAK